MQQVRALASTCRRVLSLAPQLTRAAEQQQWSVEAAWPIAPASGPQGPWQQTQQQQQQQCHIHLRNQQQGSFRGFAATTIKPDSEEFNTKMEEINNLFVSARDEIEYAHEDSETVYFDESVAEAKKLVDECIKHWDALLASLPEDERVKLMRSGGLRLEQLKAELEVVSNLHLEE